MSEDPGGAFGFAASLEELAADPILEDGLVTFNVVIASGPLAGCILRSGVDVSELAMWPACPPHWVHFPDAVDIQPTNASPSTKVGWKRHSRDIQKWVAERNHAQAWLAHVRSVAGKAV